MQRSSGRARIHDSRAWQEVGQEGQQTESSWQVQANSPEKNSWHSRTPTRAYATRNCQPTLPEVVEVTGIGSARIPIDSPVKAEVRHFTFRYLLVELNTFSHEHHEVRDSHYASACHVYVHVCQDSS